MKERFERNVAIEIFVVIGGFNRITYAKLFESKVRDILTVKLVQALDYISLGQLHI
jgi:hypothetical protein